MVKPANNVHVIYDTFDGLHSILKDAFYELWLKYEVKEDMVNCERNKKGI